MDIEWRNRLRALAFVPLLLVCCDYDSALAERTSAPQSTFPDWRALLALRLLGELPATFTAVLSGRTLQDLHTLLGEPGNELRIGSHGAEWETSSIQLSPEQQERHKHIARALTFLAQETRGLECEIKPVSVALHVRIANRRIAAATLAAAVDSFGNIPGVFVKHGLNSVEFMVVAASKEEALLRARRARHASGVLFVGDDATDEDVFRTLSGVDLGVRVGKGRTRADFRIPDHNEATSLLHELAALRCEWSAQRRVST